MIYQIPKTSMPLSDFHKLPRRLGWRYDYSDGQAFFYPEDITVDVFLPVGAPVPLPAEFRYRLCAVEEHNVHGLEDLYFNAFRPTVESYGLDDDDLRGEFQFSLIVYLSGACGKPMPHSMAILAGGRPIAAALVIDGRAGPTLKMIMVEPEYQRRRLASGLLAEVMERLRREGYDGIHSCYLAANEASRAWYSSIGFIERPNARAVRHFRHFYHYEVTRLRSDPRASATALHRAEHELARWDGFAAGLAAESLPRARGIVAPGTQNRSAGLAES